MTDITVRWAGPSDANSGSIYKIERSLDGSAWTTLAASQAATTPYVSPASTLASNAAYGASSLALVDANAFSTSGFAWIEDALVEWTGKASNTLTGVTWHSGYGIYAGGSAVYEAHESYADESVTITNNAALYRVTHTTTGKHAAAPLLIWYFAPEAPVDSHHCVVIVLIGADVGDARRVGRSVTCYLENDNEFNAISGEHLDSNEDAANSATTNALGLAFFHCVKSSRRITSDGAAVGRYVLVLDSADAQSITLHAATIPDRDWVLLSQIVSD